MADTKKTIRLEIITPDASVFQGEVDFVLVRALDGDLGIMIKRKSKRGRVFYGCSEYPNCDFVLWNQPVNKKCPVCGSIMIVKHYKTGPDKIFCSNAACENYKKGETVNEE